MCVCMFLYVNKYKHTSCPYCYEKVNAFVRIKDKKENREKKEITDKDVSLIKVFFFAHHLRPLTYLHLGFESRSHEWQLKPEWNWKLWNAFIMSFNTISFLTSLSGSGLGVGLGWSCTSLIIIGVMQL